MSSYKDPTRISAGVKGLNEILHGGLPSGQMYLLEGDPGTGKTTLAMQFIIAGNQSGEKSLYITLSEPRSELEASALSHGWNPEELPIAEFVPAEAALNPEEQYTMFHPSEVELSDTIQRLTKLIDEERPVRVVIDSLSELRLLASDTMRYRRQLLALKQFFVGRDSTVLLLDDRTANGSDMQLQSIAHGVLRLEKVPRSFGVTRRTIEIVKLRGTAYREGFHDYTIKTGGMEIYPRLVAAEHSLSFDGERIQSGVTALDLMFGGGISRGTSTLILGPTGSGKSTIALQYASAAVKRGDKASVYVFDEVLRTALDRAESLGMPVRSQIESGLLEISQVDPAELAPGELIDSIRRDVEEEDVRVVVIDSLNGFQYAMPGETDLNLHLHELIAFLNQRGVITFIVLTQFGLIGTMTSNVDVSYLADNVLLLRYFETQGTIRQAVSVVKQRVGAHERALREFSFSADGITVGKPLKNFRGILTGVPDFVENPE
jgi:circadian clock protein KaiC